MQKLIFARKNTYFLIYFLFVLFYSCENKTPQSQQKPVQEVRIINGISDATKYAVGTWTYTRPDNQWFKIVITSDGKYKEYVARPSDNDWGPVDASGTWETNTDKYYNTGNRFYYIIFNEETVNEPFALSSWYKKAIFQDVDALDFHNYTESNQQYVLSRSDVFPFSK